MTDDEMRLKLADPAARIRMTAVIAQWSRLLGEMAPPPVVTAVWPPPFPGPSKPPAPLVQTVGEAPAWIGLPSLPGSSRPR